MGGNTIEQSNLRASSGFPPRRDIRIQCPEILVWEPCVPPKDHVRIRPGVSYATAHFGRFVPDMTRGSKGSPYDTLGYFTCRSNPTVFPQPPFGPDGFLKRLRRHSDPMPSCGYHSDPMTPRHETHAGAKKGGHLRAKELRPRNSHTPRSQSTQRVT